MTEDPLALRRWMIAGPQVSQLVVQPMMKTNYAKLFKLHHDAAKAVATKRMRFASAEVREKYGRDYDVYVDIT